MKTTRAVVVGLAALIAVAPAALGRTHRAPERVDRGVEDCEETRPEAVAVKGLTDGGTEIALDVLVLLDGVDKTVAKSVLDRAAESYAPLSIAIVPRLRPVTFTADAVSLSGTEFAQPLNLIIAAKSLLGPVRPKGIDAVYVMTTKDLGSEADPGVAGFADCIGGIRYPDRSYAVGEVRDEPLNVGVNLYAETPAKIAAHEIGHLLGARHEYQSCAEGLTADDINGREATPCTVMTNYVELQSLNFGALEGAVVRGHAARYGAP
jgi:hypothetical protein